MENHETDNLVEGLSGQPVLIYNPTFGEYLFVSNDKLGDNVVESHPVQWRSQEKNQFVLQRRVNADNTCLIYNKSHNLWLFVSNDKKDNGHVVEAHSSKNEETNAFQFQLVKENLYRIYNPSSKEYLFVSKETWKSDPDHVVESHPNSNEECNEFLLELVEPPESIEDIEFFMDQKKVIAEKEPIVVDTMQYRNSSTVTQSMNFKIDKTESHQSTWTYTGGVTLGGTLKFTAKIPFLASCDISVTSSVTFTLSHSTTSTTTNTISGSVTLNAAPGKVTTGTVKIEQKEIEVPYKMTVLTKDKSQIYSYGVYKSVAWMSQFCEAVEGPL